MISLLFPPPPGGGKSARASGPGGGDSPSTRSLLFVEPPPPHPGLPCGSPTLPLQGRVKPRLTFSSQRRDEPDRLLEVVERPRSGAVRGGDRAHIEIVRRDDAVEIDRLLGRAGGVARVVALGRVVAVAPEHELLLRHVDQEV